MTDHAVQHALVVVAHPDDAEFWTGGTTACWSAGHPGPSPANRASWDWASRV